MSIGAGASSPVERFLGSQAGAGGPFALLGLEAGPCDDARILSQLQAQLDRVNSHVQAETPQADEVRLALHAAAAQLLDPVVRGHLVKRWGGVRGAPVEVHRVPKPRSAGDAPEGLLALEHDAMLVVGRSGGWNAKALRRLAILAHARGIPDHKVPEAIIAVLHRRRSRGPVQTVRVEPSGVMVDRGGVSRGASTVAVGRATGRPLTSEVLGQGRAERAEAVQESSREAEEPPSRGSWAPLIVVAGILAAMGVTAGVMLMLAPNATNGLGNAVVSPKIESPPPVAGFPESSTETVMPETARAPRPAGPPPLLRSGGAIRELLSDSTLALGVDPGATTEHFARAVRSLASCWVELGPDEVAACSDAIVEYLYRSASWPMVNLAAAEVIAGPSRRLRFGARGLDADEVWPSAWSVAMLTRLSRERDLPSAVGGVVDSALGESLGGGRSISGLSFEAGLLSVLGVQARFMVSNQVIAVDVGRERLGEVWKRWLDAVLWATRSDTATRNRLLLAGLDLLAREGPEPNVHQPTYDAMSMLAGAIDWHDAAAAQPWLVRAMASAAWSVADLYVVTSAIVQRGRAPGVDLSMVVPIRADDLVRQELRERYRLVWGLDADFGGRELAERWQELVNVTAARAQSDVTGAEHLASAARLARLNLAAELHWLGDYIGCAEMLGRFDEPVQEALQTAQAEAAWMMQVDGGDWWVRYKNAGQNVHRRRELLDELGASVGRPLGRVEAELLVMEALRGNSDVIRQKAHDVLSLFNGQATVVNAMLEFLPETPPSRRNIEALASGAMIRPPAADDPTWRLRIRRGLVERLLQLLASESDLAVIDRLGELMAEAYAARGANSPGSEGLQHVPPAEVSAGMLRLAWLRRAEVVLASPSLSMSLGSIERRRSARASMVDGPVQRFFVEQAATAELMGYVIASERPGAAGQVKAILDAMAEQRRGADHVLAQVRFAEQAMTELWSVRLGMDVP
ncbi:MAG: hypothetical protein KIT24_02610 [Phycisphaeraceae bacterium]|nr:hypothetical protein [Phycisphaeraceae bacterium]